MARIVTLSATLAFLVCLGCGQSGDVAQTTTLANTTAAASPSPTDIVSQFLDEVRRGGADSAAGSLLTVRAQQVLKEIGRTVQPLGSPDAKFEVTRGEPVPDDENAVLVHSIWTEPNEDGTKSQFQVVWAVQNESAGWRISGLAMELQPGAAPEIIDFENGALMAQLLAEPAPQQAAQNAGTETNQATAPADATIR